MRLLTVSQYIKIIVTWREKNQQLVKVYEAKTTMWEQARVAQLVACGPRDPSSKLVLWELIRTRIVKCDAN